jgi:hypothetical protein
VARVNAAAVPRRHIGDREAYDHDDQGDHDDQNEARSENVERGDIGPDDHHAAYVDAGDLGPDDHHAAHLDPAHTYGSDLNTAGEPGYNDDGQPEEKDASKVRCLLAEADRNDHHRPHHFDCIAYDDVPARYNHAGRYDAGDHYDLVNAAAALQDRAASARDDDHRDRHYDHRSDHDNDGSSYHDNNSRDDHDNGLNDYHDSPPDYHDGGNHHYIADHHNHAPADNHNHSPADNHHFVTTITG